MKTIRHNCFETNSSSTHSITIIDRKSLKEPSKSVPALLTQDLILNPGNLSDQPCYSDLSYGDGGHSLTASNRLEKAALFCHYVKSTVDYWEEENQQTIKDYTTAILKESLGYSGVNWDFYDEFSIYSEDDDNVFSDIKENDVENGKAAIFGFLQDVVLNDDVVVKDEEIPY